MQETPRSMTEGSRWCHALAIARESVRDNLWPGLLLQGCLVVFFLLFVWHEGTQKFLAHIANWKEQVSYGFAFVSYIFAAAILPEILRIGFFQKGRPTRANLRTILILAPLWGSIGVLVDGFYRVQGIIFGSGTTWVTVLPKVLVDQFIFSPFLCNPLILGYFIWREAGYQWRPAARQLFTWSFVWDRLFPVQVAAWCIWIPGVTVVYLMPPLLQIPVAVMIQCFWVLVLFSVRLRQSAVS